MYLFSELMRLRVVPAVILLFFPAHERAQNSWADAVICSTACVATVTRFSAASGTDWLEDLAAATTSAASRDTTPHFVASIRGRVFYARSCDAWRSLSSANLVWFNTAAEARAAGYEPSRSARCGAEGGDHTAATSSRSVGGTPDRCVLDRVVDGDTVDCADGTRIRLLLIDTPEMSQGPFGRQARQFVVDLVPRGTSLAVRYDVDKHDRYGRSLAYLYTPDGTMVNEAVALAGYAYVSTYAPNVKYVNRIRAAVQQAQVARAGLWATSAFECAPADHRANRCE